MSSFKPLTQVPNFQDTIFGDVQTPSILVHFIIHL